MICLLLIKPHGVDEYSVDRNGIVENGFAVGKAALCCGADNFGVGEGVADTDVKAFEVVIIGVNTVAVVNDDRIARRSKITVAADLLTVCARLAIEEKYGE